MSDIDDKFDFELAGLVLKCASVNPQELPVTAELVEQIKQAFIDDGWVRVGKIDSEVKTITAPQFDGSEIVYMTGQEWYDRFKEEFKVIGWPRKTEVTINIHSVLEAAKKAAGIE